MNAMKVLSPFLYISIMGIIGPIAEEIMFRLIFVDKLRNRIVRQHKLDILFTAGENC
jgi:membrane protease YdiL (CAAX protease family)